MAPRDGGKLTFSFDAEVAGGVSALRRDQSVRFSDVSISDTLRCSLCACIQCSCLELNHMVVVNSAIILNSHDRLVQARHMLSVLCLLAAVAGPERNAAESARRAGGQRTPHAHHLPPHRVLHRVRQPGACHPTTDSARCPTTDDDRGKSATCVG
jgi:hypothetical protein